MLLIIIIILILAISSTVLSLLFNFIDIIGSYNERKAMGAYCSIECNINKKFNDAN